jgi:predicted O-methyltransferase YrrM
VGGLLDVRAQTVVDRLHALNRRQLPGLIAHFVRRSVPNWLKGSTLKLDTEESYLSDKFISLDPAKCELCYALCRALKAKVVVEVGTSFGVSTIYLAAAVRDAGEAQDRVIGTEIDPAKAARARANFAAAGVETYIELREGDVLETLKDVQGPIDFALIDTWIPIAHTIIKQLAPLLRPGAIVVCDNTKRFRTAYSDNLNFVNDSSNGFRSALLPYAGGLEISIKT